MSSLAFLNPADAMREIRSGKTVRYDTTDGYATIKKKNPSRYTFTVHTNGVELPTINVGSLQNVITTLGDERFKQGLYLVK